MISWSCQFTCNLQDDQLKLSVSTPIKWVTVGHKTIPIKCAVKCYCRTQNNNNKACSQVTVRLKTTIKRAVKLLSDSTQHQPSTSQVTVRLNNTNKSMGQVTVRLNTTPTKHESSYCQTLQHQSSMGQVTVRLNNTNKSMGQVTVRLNTTPTKCESSYCQTQHNTNQAWVKLLSDSTQQQHQTRHNNANQACSQSRVQLSDSLSDTE